MDSTVPDCDLPADELPDREGVQRRLEQRFPEVDARMVAVVIHRAAEVTAGAKIQSISNIAPATSC
jgi:hypothetical protein